MSARLHELCLLPTGQVRMSVDPAQAEPEAWVYQRRNEGKGNIISPGGRDLQLRRKGRRTDRLTSKNAPHRARFAAANAAWQALTKAEQDHYRQRAKSLPITGYNLWMREYRVTTPAHRRRAASINAIIGLHFLETIGLCL
jgi:hypothetical protein